MSRQLTLPLGTSRNGSLFECVSQEVSTESAQPVDNDGDLYGDVGASSVKTGAPFRPATLVCVTLGES